MKKFKLILLVIIVFITNANAQQKIQDITVSFNLSNGLHKSESNQETIQKIKQLDGKLRGILSFYEKNDNFSSTFYFGNEHVKVFFYYSYRFNSSTDYLEVRKKGLYNLLSLEGSPLPNNYSAIIKQLPNCEVLITKKDENDIYREVYCQVRDLKHTKYLNFTLINRISDNAAVDQIVEDMIKSIDFNTIASIE